MKRGYVVEVRRVVVRGSLERGTTPVFTYARDSAHPVYPTRNAAKIAAMLRIDPSLKGLSEELVIRQFNAWARNNKTNRVVREPIEASR
jgi:hypothetical protein